MPIGIDYDDETLLTYTLNTFPNPIEVSPPKNDSEPGSSKTEDNDDISKAAITIVVSNNDRYDDICCKSLRFEFEPGEGATELTSDPGAIELVSSTSKWQTSNNKDGSFTANPKTTADRLITDQGLAFELKGIKVNRAVGTFTLTITEESKPVDSNSAENPCADGGYDYREKEVNLAKFPFGFYAGNFRPEEPMVKNGERILLKWDGSALADYSISYDGNAPVDVSNKRKWKSPALHNTTTFILKAVARIDEELDIKNPPALYFSTTVIVANPEFVATSTAVSNNTDLETLKKAAKATLYVENTTKDSKNYAAEIINNSANVGALHVKNKGNFRAALIESTSAASTLRVVNSNSDETDARALYLESHSKKATTLWAQNKNTTGGSAVWINNASTDPALVAQNKKGGYALDVKGKLLAEGQVDVKGGFSGFKKAQKIEDFQFKVFRATTDGIIMPHLSQSGIMEVHIYDGPENSDPLRFSASSGDNFTGVIRTGGTVQFSVYYAPSAIASVYFIPLGNGKLEEVSQSSQQIKEREAEAHEQMQTRQKQYDDRRGKFIDALEGVLGESIAEDKRTTLNEALKALIGG